MPTFTADQLGAESMHDVINQIVGEYNQKIAEMTRLTERLTDTANLAERLHVAIDNVPEKLDLAGEVEPQAVCEASPEENLETVSVATSGSAKIAEFEFCELGASNPQRSQMTEQAKSLSQGWELNAAWKRARNSLHVGVLSSGFSSLQVADDLEDETMHDFSHAEELTGVMRHVVGSPGTRFRISWELIGMAFVLYDLIAIPLSAAFEPPSTTFSDTMGWVVLLFWTINVPVTLTTGVILNGILISSPWLILKQYCRSWFIVDAVTLVPDWFMVVSSMLGGDSGSAGSLIKLLRLLRLLRLARLFRLVKLRNAWTLLYDKLDSEKVGLVVDVLKMVLVLLIVNHYVACAWFAVALSQDGNNWVEAYGFTRDKVDWGHQYVVAYHWSITQFTPSSMHVQPHCVNERVFAIITVVFALVGFSYLVGSITGSLGRLRAMGEKKTQMFWLMRRFLRRSKVPSELSLRIKSYVESVWEHQQNHMKQENVEILNLLSHHLTGELKLCVHSTTLNWHPLLLHLQTSAPSTMRRLVFSGLSQVSFAPRDVVANVGEVATHMSFVIEGILEYSCAGNDFSGIVESAEDWIAEPALWVAKWKYLGDLKSVRSSEISRIEAEAFASVVQLNPMSISIVTNYAAKYVEWLQNTEEGMASDISCGREVEETLATFVHGENYRKEICHTPGRPGKQGTISTNARRFLQDTIGIFDAIEWHQRLSGEVQSEMCPRESLRPASHRRTHSKRSMRSQGSSDSLELGTTFSDETHRIKTDKVSEAETGELFGQLPDRSSQASLPPVQTTMIEKQI